MLNFETDSTVRCFGLPMQPNVSIGNKTGRFFLANDHLQQQQSSRWPFRWKISDGRFVKQRKFKTVKKQY